ncbi:hypothetical protein VCHENC02_5623A, partial [Vibrio harveyi]
MNVTATRNSVELSSIVSFLKLTGLGSTLNLT